MSLPTKMCCGGAVHPGSMTLDIVMDVVGVTLIKAA